MRYVVTGAAGFIGSQLAHALLEEGHDVVGVDCFTDYYDPAEKEENARGLDLRRTDLAEESLDLEGIDGVFHLAAQAGVRSFGEGLSALRSPESDCDTACRRGVRQRGRAARSCLVVVRLRRG